MYGANHRRFNSDRLVFLLRLEDEAQERPTRQACALQRATVHRNVRDAIGRVHAVVGKELRLYGGGEPLVLTTIERLNALAGLSIERVEFIHAQLAPKEKDMHLLQHALHHPGLGRHADERRSTVGTPKRFHPLDSVSISCVDAPIR
jgi:hypothetical protein